MAFNYSITLDDAQNYGGASDAILVADLNAALAKWSHYITGNGTLVVDLQIVQTPVGRMSGASTTSYYVGTQNGLQVFEPSSIYELQTGTHVSGSTSDITIQVSPSYFQYLDLSAPMTYGSPSAQNKYNPVYLFMHELEHGFGMAGYYDQSGHLPGAYESTFDALLNVTANGATYIGAQGDAAWGGPIPITTNSTAGENYYHFGNTQSDINRTPQTVQDPLTLDLMNGIVFYFNHAYPVSKIDLGVLKDLGYTVLNSATYVADLSDDGRSDVLFRNAGGTTYLWTMNNQNVANGAPTSLQVGTNWQIRGIGDFNGDGAADLLWVYNNPSNPSDGLNGVSYISLQNGVTATSGSGVVQQLASNWQLVGVGDFDGDGSSDVLYRDLSSGRLYLDIMNGTSITSSSGFTSQQVGDLRWQVAGLADYSGDGKTDILWRYDNTANAADSLNGALYEWTMNGTNVVSANLVSQQPGSDHWTVAGSGDFDGNGTWDVLFRYENNANTSDPLNGLTYIDFMNGSQVTSGGPTQWQVDNSWAIASVGDYNGDGKSDLLFQHAGDGNTYIWDMNGRAVTGGNFTSLQSGAGWTVQNGALIG